MFKIKFVHYLIISFVRTYFSDSSRQNPSGGTIGVSIYSRFSHVEWTLWKVPDRTHVVAHSVSAPSGVHVVHIKVIQFTE